MADEEIQNGASDAGAIEEYSLADIEVILEKAGEPYYCVDTIWAPQSRKKLIDTRSILSPSIIRNFLEWGLGPNQIIRVTRNPDSIGEDLEKASRNVSLYSNRLHHYLTKIFRTGQSGNKVEIQGIAKTGVELLDGPLGLRSIDGITVGPSDLRTHTSYFDHLVNTAVYWLAAFAALNRKNKLEAGSVENWKTRNKPEMSRLMGGMTHKVDFSVYYDIYDRDSCATDIESHKKSDLSLVLSGFYGALFHDIGLLSCGNVIISRPGAAVDDNMKRHPAESNALLKEKLPILADERPLTRSIIANHHEYIDGSGYPSGKKGSQIHIFAQILSIADMYDEYSLYYARGTVLRFMARGAGTFFSGEALRAFFSILRPYDAGEVVDVFRHKSKKPSMKAEVLDSPNKLRPKIRIITALSPEGSDFVGSIIDLADNQNAVFII